MSKPLPSWLWVSLATLFAFAVRAFRLGNPDLWLDEATTYCYTLEPWHRLVGELKSVDVHPPYYYLLQKAWDTLGFGQSRLALRSLPLLLGTSCVPLTYLLGRKVISERAGVIAAFLLTTVPMHVYQSRELRMYPLLNASALIAVLGLAHAVLSRGELPLRGAAQRAAIVPWALYTFGCVSAFYAQSTSVILPLLAFAFVLGLVLGKRTPRATLYACVAANTVVLIAILPWMLILSRHVGSTLAGFWIPKPTLEWVRGQLLGTYACTAWAKPFIYSALALGAWVLRKQRVALLFVLAFVVGQPLVMWALSHVRPILVSRAMVWPIAIALLLPATLFSRMPRAAGLAATAAFVLLQSFALAPFYPDTVVLSDADALEEPFEAFDVQRDVLVIEDPSFEWALRPEIPKPFTLGRALALRRSDTPDMLAPLLRARHVKRAELTGLLSAAQRIWLLYEKHPRFPHPHDPVKGLTEALILDHAVLDSWESPTFTLYLLAPSAHDSPAASGDG